jgi:RHS repeat-associated protein
VNGTKTYFLYNSSGLCAELDETGAELRSYGYAPGSVVPLFLKKNGEIYYYLNDHLGAPQKIISSSGRVVWSAVYGAYGKALVSVQEIENNFRFPGQYFDPETGLHYNFFRYYDTETGRYISVDPARSGMNFYAYCKANPLNFVDPYGLCAYTSKQRNRLNAIMGAMRTEAEIQRDAADASISLNNWQWGRAIGDIASAGYGAFSALRNAGKVAASAFSSIQKAGATSVLRNVKNAETGLSMVDEIAIQSSRAAYATTAIAEITEDRVMDKLIEKGAGSLVGDDSLSQKSAGDLIYDSIAGGDETQKDLMNMAEKSGKRFDSLNRYYNILKKQYNKNCN